MKQLFSFIQKEFYHISRDRRTLLILLVMPLIQLLLFGYAITTEVKNVQVAVLDPSKDISTQRIIHQMNSSEYFTVAQTINNASEINDVFKSGKINLMLVFSDNFHNNLFHTGEAQIQLIADGTDPNQARTQVQYATNIIMQYQQELLHGQKIPLQIKSEVKMLYNPQIKSSYNFVPGIMGLILMLICAMMTSISIVREKEMGTMEILLASPMRPIYIILAKAVPYFVISVINLITILLLSVFVLGVPIAGSISTLMLVSFIFIMVNLSLGLMVSSLVDTQVAAMLVSSMGLMMPVMLLSGMIFPVESMPVVLQWISNLIPAKWYIISVRKVMISGLDITSIFKELTVLLVMCIFLLTVSLKNFKSRLE